MDLSLSSFPFDLWIYWLFFYWNVVVPFWNGSLELIMIFPLYKVVGIATIFKY